MNRLFRTSVRQRALWPVAAALLCSAVNGLASGNGPNGINIGFNFNWSSSHPPEPLGYSASFIEGPSGSGASLNNCAGPTITASTVACNFVITYSVGGVAQPAVVPGGVYETWPIPPPVGSACDENPLNSAPLTLYNCFNNNSFGQIFLASATGALSGVTMSMTCLNPAGGPLIGLVALLYQVTGGGSSIPGTPIASVPVNLSTCPTLTTWSGHTFSGADFAAIPLNFQDVAVTAGNFYAVFFGGITPGSQPPGGPPTVTSVTPGYGPPAGGNSVTISGTNFTGATSVTFGGVAATSFTVVNATTITATVPSGAVGTVSVIVTTPVSSSAANTLYMYVLSIPILSGWGMLGLAALLVLYGVFRLRRQGDVPETA